MSKGSENNRSEFRKQAHEFKAYNAVNFPLARSNKKALPCGEFFYWTEGNRTLLKYCHPSKCAVRHFVKGTGLCEAQILIGNNAVALKGQIP